MAAAMLDSAEAKGKGYSEAVLRQTTDAFRARIFFLFDWAGVAYD